MKTSEIDCLELDMSSTDIESHPLGTMTVQCACEFRSPQNKSVCLQRCFNNTVRNELEPTFDKLHDVMISCSVYDAVSITESTGSSGRMACE